MRFIIWWTGESIRQIVHFPERTLRFEERQIVERVAVTGSSERLPEAPVARIVEREFKATRVDNDIPRYGMQPSGVPPVTRR